MPPRPRPRTKTTASQSPDELFLRNTNLTTQTWKNLNKRSEEAPVVIVDDGSPKKNRKRPNNPAGPSWKQLSALHNDDDDDLFAEDSDESTSRTKQINRSPKKLKRARSRSKSLTPPPELSFAQVQNAKNLVREALGASSHRPPSPKAYDDESQDTSFHYQNADLASVARKAKATQNYTRSTSTPVDDDAPTVAIKVRWKPHPLDKLAQSEVWGFKMRRNDTFRQLFDDVADTTSTLVDNLVLSHSGRRIYSSSTPQGLHMWAEAELDACNQTTYDYMRSNNIRFSAKENEQTTLSPPSGDTAGITLSDDEGGSESDDDDDGVQAMTQGAAASDTFRLTLRSDKTSKDIVLTVRPSTKCGSIVKAFLKKAGLADKYLEAAPKAAAKKRRGRKSLVVVASGPKILVDGDKMDNDTEISEADLEDGDMVEVVGL